MVKGNILEETKRLIAGEKLDSPAYQNPEVAKEISNLWKREDLEKEGILLNEVQKYKLSKTIVSYFGKRDLAQQVLQIQPIYYDEAKIWWIWEFETFKWKMVDETDILNFVNNISVANTIKSKEKSEILEALKQESRLKKPQAIKRTWIQFKDLIIDIETGEEYEASSKYFVTNPIPYSLDQNRFMETPNMDRIFEEWVGSDYVKTLKEILAYSLLPDYPIHRLFCFIGEGMNGKSCFLRLLSKFVGEYNITSSELDTLLSSRFEKTRLHKKLVCIMGETNFNEISQSSILKKLTGQDTIGFEYKGKNPFEDYNYAKIIIATNNLPTTTDKTIGFYRRWFIIDFPNRFSEHKDILSTIPEEEYNALAVKSIFILKDLLKNKKFYNEGDIEERIKKYEEKSNPFEKFWNEFIIEDPDNQIWSFELSKRFGEWCKENKFRQFSDESIAKKMKEKGINKGVKWTNWLIEGHKKQLRCWTGIKWKQQD